MGFYYGSNQPEPEEKPPGCIDVLVVTRAVFSVLLWPLLALFIFVLDVAVIFWTFAVHPALALVPIALTAIGIWLFARWEQRRARPPEWD